MDVLKRDSIVAFTCVIKKAARRRVVNGTDDIILKRCMTSTFQWSEMLTVDIARASFVEVQKESYFVTRGRANLSECVNTTAGEGFGAQFLNWTEKRSRLAMWILAVLSHPENCSSTRYYTSSYSDVDLIACSYVG